MSISETAAAAPHLSTVRAWLRDLITPMLPEDWDIIHQLSDTKEALTTQVYMTFRTIDNADTPQGQAIAEMVVEVSPPQTANDDAADDGVVQLICSLHHRKVQWARAEKKRDPGGPIVWEVTVRLIVTVPNP